MIEVPTAVPIALSCGVLLALAASLIWRSPNPAKTTSLKPKRRSRARSQTRRRIEQPLVIPKKEIKGFSEPAEPKERLRARNVV
jgi:hypothetical protein